MYSKKKSFQTSQLGKFTTNVRNSNSEKSHTWINEHKLEGQAKSTVFIVEGDAKQPNDKQLNSILKIVDSLDEIKKQLDKWLKTQPNLDKKYEEDWMKNFFLGAIIIYNVDKRGLFMQFEVTFDSINDKEDSYIDLIWDNGNLIEIENQKIKFHETNRKEI